RRRRALSAQGGADGPRQCRAEPEPHQRRAVQRNRRPITAMQSRDQIDQDALAAEWGLALEADAEKAEADKAATPESQEAGEAAASQWAAMVDEGSQIIQTAR